MIRGYNPQCSEAETLRGVNQNLGVALRYLGLPSCYIGFLSTTLGLPNNYLG